MKIFYQGALALLIMGIMNGGSYVQNIFAATTPSLGDAASYGILSSTYVNTAAGTTINGAVGFTTAPAVMPAGTHIYSGSGTPYSSAGIAQGSALASLASEACTFSFAPGAIDLSTDTTHGPIGVYTPGVYCSVGAMQVGGTLTLSGNGTFIFRAQGALDTTAGATVTVTNGASACNVFWTPTAATTLGANTTFIGTVIDDAGITVGANTTRLGLGLSFGGTITTDTSTITVPSCPVSATLRVVKLVRTGANAAISSDFLLYVKSAGINVSGSPLSGSVAPGNSYTLNAGTYVVSEDINPLYVQSFSGDCDASGNVVLSTGSNKTCTIINTSVPALVLPGGGGFSPVSFVMSIVSTGIIANSVVVTGIIPSPLITGSFALVTLSGNILQVSLHGTSMIIANIAVDTGLIGLPSFTLPVSIPHTGADSGSEYPIIMYITIVLLLLIVSHIGFRKRTYID